MFLGRRREKEWRRGHRDCSGGNGAERCPQKGCGMKSWCLTRLGDRGYNSFSCFKTDRGRQSCRFSGLGASDMVFSQAELMELADMQDLGSCAARREGSNPSFRILWREAEHERFGLHAFLCGYEKAAGLGLRLSAVFPREDWMESRRSAWLESGL